MKKNFIIYVSVGLLLICLIVILLKPSTRSNLTQSTFFSDDNTLSESTLFSDDVNIETKYWAEVRIERWPSDGAYSAAIGTIVESNHLVKDHTVYVIFPKGKNESEQEDIDNFIDNIKNKDDVYLMLKYDKSDDDTLNLCSTNPVSLTEIKNIKMLEK